VRRGLRGGAPVAFLTGTLLSVAGCRDYLTVGNPNVIAGDALDPRRDATTLSLSARANYNVVHGYLASLSSFLVGETWPASPTAEVNQFGLRSVVPTNQLLHPWLWSNLSVSLASNERVVQLLAGTGAESGNIDLARSLLFSGYSMILMGENFCQAVIMGGPPLTSQQVLDSAIARLTRAAAVARAAGGGTPTRGTEAFDVLNAALVGRARAELQLGRRGAAASGAAAVAGAWTYNLLYADNPAARSRLGNRQYQLTRDAALIVVPPAWRTGDPRVPFAAPGTVPGLPQVGEDGVIPFYAQTKYASYDAPVRLASRLEADYIAAEATGTSAMLALIATRRTANGQPPYAGPADDASVLTELEEQRGREFYLEGKRLGDLRRNPAAVLHVPPPGSTYFKPGFGAVGDQTCFPLPLTETATNPNFPKP
jgi:starch-binding outer membrane protein, SusD/RagB family